MHRSERERTEQRAAKLNIPKENIMFPENDPVHVAQGQHIDDIGVAERRQFIEKGIHPQNTKHQMFNPVTPCEFYQKSYTVCLNNNPEHPEKCSGKLNELNSCLNQHNRVYAYLHHKQHK